MHQLWGKRLTRTAVDGLGLSRMDNNYDFAYRASRFGPTFDETPVDGMIINPVSPLAAGRTVEGNHLELKNILLAHRRSDHLDRLVEDSSDRRSQGTLWLGCIACFISIVCICRRERHCDRQRILLCS